MAQVMVPIAAPMMTQGPNGKSYRPITVSVQGEYFHWVEPATGYVLSVEPKGTALLGSVDVPVGQRFIVGGWASKDQQKVLFITTTNHGQTLYGNANLTTNWLEGHVTYLLKSTPETSLGVSVGVLSASEPSTTFKLTSGQTTQVTERSASSDRWTEINFLLSRTVAHGKNASQPLVGATIGYVRQQTSGAGSGLTYGVSISCPIASKVSIDASTWNISPSGGSTITRFGLGCGVHF
jgi:hypothetical protein